MCPQVELITSDDLANDLLLGGERIYCTPSPSHPLIWLFLPFSFSWAHIFVASEMFAAWEDVQYSLLYFKHVRHNHSEKSTLRYSFTLNYLCVRAWLCVLCA